jgi:tRNA nucleotidyltransferase/poly(A) polymerase
MSLKAVKEDLFRRLALAAAAAGGRLYVAGGLVRDAFFEEIGGGRPLSEEARLLADRDAVCLGLDLEGVRGALSAFGPGAAVGHRTLAASREKEPFLVPLNVGGVRATVTAGRRALGGRVVFDPGAGLEEDSLSRDFTINSLHYDPLAEKFVVPPGAGDDFRARRLEIRSPGALRDDPLRILRAMVLLSRLGLAPGPGLLAAAGRDWPGLGLLPAGRLWPEWRRWALSARPRLGLEYLKSSGALAFWPELSALVGSPQRWKFHPEGDAWNHTALVVQSMGELGLTEARGRVFLTMAALLHDVGKPKATETLPDGSVSTRGHGPAGLPLAAKFLREAGAPGIVAKKVLRLVGRHMDLTFRPPEKMSLTVLARRLHPLCDLSHFWALARADWNGRRPNLESYPWSLDEFLEPVGGRVGPGEIPLEAPELMARLGLPGGPAVGGLMRAVAEAFDLGRVSTREEALELAASLLAETGPDGPRPASRRPPDGRAGAA